MAPPASRDDGDDDEGGAGTRIGALRVAVCDDHPAISMAMGAFLARAPGTPALEVVTAATSAEGLLSRWQRGTADVALLDVDLGGEGGRRAGLDLATRLRAHEPDLAILFYSGAPEPTLVRDALRGGAAGFVSKSVASDELADAVRRVAAGERPVLDAATATDLAMAGMQATHLSQLSPREHEVLEQVASGLTNASIGRRLGISENSVKSLLRRALGKLDAADRASAVATAFRRGLLH